MSFDYSSHSHRRYNPLTRAWILCSPHRNQRPWQGQKEKVNQEDRPHYDSQCYLCPGNKRAHGDINPNYTSTFCFMNDFAAVQDDQPSSTSDDEQDDLLRIQGVRGECHVICFSPRHDLTMAEMTTDDIVKIIYQWIKCYRDMASKDFIRYVQIFENKGQAMGCSNPHPHGQLWCLERTPVEPQREFDSLIAYREIHHGHCLLCDYAKREIKEQTRIVVENDTFLCVVPFWAVWPFEVLLLPKDHVTCLPQLSSRQIDDLADALRRITCRYDNLFQCPFPYSMGIHQAPVRQNHDYAHLHFHFYPPLLRSATIRKFLVGFEMLAEPQRDLTPEQAANQLRACSEIHYKQQHQQ
ncbi:galactose-1-phosphate uridylyltransferase [Phascolomyces articulosus]|uniref:Galactose-1-phosphate uridylyltransferase n=1 Tax=Phascolomyces articulosus TaxID=60185 RepID=A0AAD5JWR1_9FUNG|nr:galactose-1-phosphate uridylyltransferase [Phascolomyces articulosus]